MTDFSFTEKEHRVESWLRVASFGELMKLEKEILARIENFPNGGQLFLIHPFMLLQDIGVQLSSHAEQEIRQHESRLTGLSVVPYQALKKSKEKQNIRFHLRGLFERTEEPWLSWLGLSASSTRSICADVA